MFNRQGLHIAMLLWGSIFSLIAAICMFLSKNFEKTKRRDMLHLLLCSSCLLFSDAVAWGYRGISGRTAGYVVLISNFLVFFLSDVMLFLYHDYLCYTLFGKDDRRDKRIMLGYGIAVLAMLLVILSQYTHLYYNIDANNLYYRRPGYFLSVLLPLFVTILDVTLLVQYRKRLSVRTFAAMLSYIVLPILAMIGLLFYYGISLTNIAISISMILLFAEAVMEQNENLAQKEKQLWESQIALTISQIQPHFLYNTLSTIAELCRKDPEMAEEVTNRFAGYLRMNLEHMGDRTPVSFQKELAHVRTYLWIEKIRFQDAIRVVYDIRTENFRLPALSVQPLVENAVKHGMMGSEKVCTITIMASQTKTGYQVVIRDDGCGFDVTQRIKNDGRDHVGIDSVRSRLEMMVNGTLTITSEIGKGTKVVIDIPDEEETGKEAV